MLINERYRKLATFLYEKTSDDSDQTNLRPCGTAFLISVEYSPDHFDVYAVTARHVITQSYHKASLYLRINIEGGTFQDLELQHRNWFQHHSTDVAIIPINIPLHADVKALPSSHLANDDFIVRHRVGEGDEVFFIGLFSEHSGVKKSLPIIRFGNISLMPYEPVKIVPEPNTNPISVEAYLVEARSWGGQSGSPTFIHFPPDRHPGVITMPEWPLKEPSYILLGLVSGHFDISTNTPLSGAEEDIKIPHNSGIGVIIPAKYILEILDWPELQDRREQLKRQVNNSNES